MVAKIASPKSAKGKTFAEDLRGEVRVLNNGHHTAPRQNVTSKRKSSGARGSARP